jgi:serine/threonine protein kinase
VADDPGTSWTSARAPGTLGMLMPGSKVAGYVIEEQIGAGGMAVVYRARDDVLGRLVAVKVLSPTLAWDEEFRARFLRESRAVAAVDEPHIVPVYGAGDAGGLLYIATRFVAGGDLLRLQRAAGGWLAPARVADLVSQVASALDAAHAIGLVHRDVKPGNILVESVPGRPEHAYLSDFGLSKSTTADTTGLTATGRFMGTPDYCAPEQITGGTLDGRADQYSLACVGFSLLAGVVPFSRGDSLARLFAHVNSPVPALTSVRPELPAAVNGVLARGMAKNPAERYESCAAFAGALRGALGIGAGVSQSASPPQSPGSFSGNGGYQQTVAAGGWQNPSVPPGPASVFPHNARATVTTGTGQVLPQGPGQVLPGPGQVFLAPGQGQRPPRRNTRLIVGGSVAAAVVLGAGVIAGVTLSGQHGESNGPAGSSSGTASSSGGAGQTGTASLVASLSAPDGNPMRRAFFSADGNYIAAASTKADIYIFSTETRKLIQTVSVGANDVAVPVSFSPDDKTLYAVDTTAGKLYDLDIATGKPSHVYPLPGGLTLGATVGGSSVAGTFSPDGTVAEYEMATGKLYAQVPNPGTATVADVAVDGDGKYILISDTNDVSYLVDMLSKRVVASFHYTYSGSSTFFPYVSLDGNTVYVPGGSTAAAKLWDTTTGTYVTPTDSRWPTTDNGITLSIDSKFALTSPTIASEVVDIWNIATRSHVITVTVPGSANEAVESLGPGASELLSTGSLDTTTGTFRKLDIWSLPG